MGRRTSGQGQYETASTEKKIEQLYGLIDGIDIAMLTTRRRDGSLVSRPMATQEHTGPADLWFATDVNSGKIDEIRHDPHVNLAYYRDRTNEWVSVSGTATISQDRDRIHELYRPDWRAWFGREAGGDGRAGTAEDPRIAVIDVEAHSASYMKNDAPRPVVLFRIAKSMITRTPPSIGRERFVSGDELRARPRRA